MSTQQLDQNNLEMNLTTTVIAIINPNNESQTSPCEFIYQHKYCEFNSKPMRLVREKISDIVRLTCACGLSFSFPQIGTTARTISEVSIDGVSREIYDDFSNNEIGKIFVFIIGAL